MITRLLFIIFVCTLTSSCIGMHNASKSTHLESIAKTPVAPVPLSSSSSQLSQRKPICKNQHCQVEQSLTTLTDPSAEYADQIDSLDDLDENWDTCPNHLSHRSNDKTIKDVIAQCAASGKFPSLIESLNEKSKCLEEHQSDSDCANTHHLNKDDIMEDALPLPSEKQFTKHSESPSKKRKFYASESDSDDDERPAKKQKVGQSDEYLAPARYSEKQNFQTISIIDSKLNMEQFVHAYCTVQGETVGIRHRRKIKLACMIPQAKELTHLPQMKEAIIKALREKTYPQKMKGCIRVLKTQFEVREKKKPEENLDLQSYLPDNG